MPESRTLFCVLIEDVLGSLKEQHYMDSTLTVYRRLYNRVHSLMKENDTEKYTKEIGQAFLKNVDVCCSAFREYSCAIRRLDDFIDGKPYSALASASETTEQQTGLGIGPGFYCLGR